MAKGKTKIKFIGGFLDGTLENNVDSRGVISELVLSTGNWFKEHGEDVKVIKGGKPDSEWIAFETHTFKKGCKDKNGYIEYNFIQSVIVKRCSSTTKAGKQCMKSCYKNLSVCETHKK